MLDGIAAAVEAIEHLGHVLRRDADALVPDGDAEIVAVRRQLEADRSTRRRVLVGVLDQVQQHLLEAIALGHRTDRPLGGLLRQGEQQRA